VRELRPTGRPLGALPRRAGPGYTVAAAALRRRRGDGGGGADRLEVAGGLDAFFLGKVAAAANGSSGPAGVAAALSPLLAAGAAALPPGARPADARVLLRGTAGLRRLGGEQRAALLSAAAATLAGSGFALGGAGGGGPAAVLSGSQEAALGWAALNYGQPGGGEGGAEGEKGGQGAAASRPPPPVGLLDLGGASLEIAFPSSPPPSSSSLPSPPAPRLTTASYAGAGLDDAWAAAGRAGAATAGGGKGAPAHHPCAHAGWAEGGARPAHPGAAWDVCQAVARAVAAAALGAPPPRPGAQAAGQLGGGALATLRPPPPPGTAFVATAGFGVVHRFFFDPAVGIGREHVPAEPATAGAGAWAAALEAAGADHCSRPWPAVAASPAAAAEPGAPFFCFRAPYVAALLRGLVGAEEEGQGVRLVLDSAAEGGGTGGASPWLPSLLRRWLRRPATAARAPPPAAGWPLGAALEEAGTMPSRTPRGGRPWPALALRAAWVAAAAAGAAAAALAAAPGPPPPPRPATIGAVWPKSQADGGGGGGTTGFGRSSSGRLRAALVTGGAAAAAAARKRGGGRGVG